jgi:hypothetical protein
MSHRPDVINEPREETSWFNIAHDTAQAWLRHERPGASFSEYHEWVVEEYEPYILRSGFGWRPGRALTASQRDYLDDVHRGLREAARAEQERREARRRNAEHPGTAPLAQDGAGMFGLQHLVPTERATAEGTVRTRLRLRKLDGGRRDGRRRDVVGEHRDHSSSRSRPQGRRPVD